MVAEVRQWWFHFNTRPRVILAGFFVGRVSFSLYPFPFHLVPRRTKSIISDDCCFSTISANVLDGERPRHHDHDHEDKDKDDEDEDDDDGTCLRVHHPAGASSPLVHYSYYSPPSASMPDIDRYVVILRPCHVRLYYLKDRKRLRGVKLLMFVLRGRCLDRKNGRRFLSVGTRVAIVNPTVSDFS